METVLRRSPWSYADSMLVLQRWTPLMDMALLNFISFWIQIRGILLQYMNREVIVNIARNMGQYIQMDYNEESGARLEFVRVRINWDVSHPLKFQRNFQFQLGVNTLLKFQYERLRGFCEICGMLTHDSGACLYRTGALEMVMKMMTVKVIMMKSRYHKTRVLSSKRLMKRQHKEMRERQRQIQKRRHMRGTLRCKKKKQMMRSFGVGQASARCSQMKSAMKMITIHTLSIRLERQIIRLELRGRHG